MKSAELEVLDQLIARSRTRLRTSVDQVGANLERATDCSAQIREHPLASLGIAAGLGTIGGVVAGKTLRGRSKSPRSGGARFVGQPLLTAARLLVLQGLVRSGIADSITHAAPNSVPSNLSPEVSQAADFASL